MDVERLLARYVVETDYEDLPPAVVALVKEHIFDMLGTVLGGSAGPGCATVVDLVKEWGGRGESTILAYGGRVPSPQAALANSTMGHALDFDDNDDRIAYKGSVTVVPAALAVAEAKGGVGGRELITAVCLGLDVGCRIGLATNPKPSHAGAPAPGYFGSAVASAKLLGLDEEGVMDALSIAYCHLAIGGVSIISPALTKRLTAGLSARAGAFSATLASRGYAGGREFLHGSRGYFSLYRGGEGDLELLTQDLGRRFEIVHCPKPYPSCRFTHAPIEATLALVEEYHLTPEDIQEVRVRLSGRAIHIGGGADGALLPRKRRPQGVLDAQFSAPYTVATAIVKGTVAIADFSPEALGDPRVLALAERVVPVLDPELDGVADIITPAVVEIKARDGRRFERRVDHARGSPQNPLTPEGLRQKFWGCVAEAARPLTRARVEEAVAMLERLEEVGEVGEIARRLAA